MNNLEERFFHQAAEAIVKLARLRSEDKADAEVLLQIKHAKEVAPVIGCFMASAHHQHGNMLYQIASVYGWGVKSLAASDAIEGLAFKMAEMNEQQSSY